MNSKVLSACLVSLLALTACDGGTADPSNTGGSPGSGGQSHTGGSSGGSGGTVGSGGNTGSGGVTGNGGMTGTGGSSASGGATSSGGSGSGGAATGGKTGSGGAGSGGAGATGGSVSTGGSGSGGATATGGAGTGGVTAAGGATAKGGTTGGGGTGVGGVTGVGGATGVGGGTSSPPGASGYPAAGASGQAKPSGAGTTVTVVAWAGFKGALSFTFDDTNSSQISNYDALQALNDKGNNVRYTFYLQTNKTTELGNAVWPKAVKDGHELGNHTQSHQSAASASDIQTAEDTIKSKFGVTAYSVAAPNGDQSYQTVVPSMKKFLTNRTAGNSGGISMTDDPTSKEWALPCIIPATGANASTMEGLFKNDVTGGKWQVFLVHGFSGGSDGAYQPVSITEFTSTVKWARDQGTIWVDTVENVSAYWIGAYKFSKLAAATSGTDKTWTWKTSDFNTPFPPGHYLRVTTNGGTLKQGSTTLGWDDHGYYEVSLDAGTLTLSAQ
jgi:hypothetical protein